MKVILVYRPNDPVPAAFSGNGFGRQMMTLLVHLLKQRGEEPTIQELDVMEDEVGVYYLCPDELGETKLNEEQRTRLRARRILDRLTPQEREVLADYYRECV